MRASRVLFVSASLFLLVIVSCASSTETPTRGCDEGALSSEYQNSWPQEIALLKQEQARQDYLDQERRERQFSTDLASAMVSELPD
jgi:hypothetical protein